MLARTITWSSPSVCLNSRLGRRGRLRLLGALGRLDRLELLVGRKLASLGDDLGRHLDAPKEFSLLEFFLRHPGTVLSRSQIIEAVWDFAYDGTSNVVDQYVKYLRRKVDIPFGRNDIQTVRGMGYRLRHDGPA